jgi:hypothetical protein
MNKFQIILRPVRGLVNGRTKQHYNLEQTMAFRINTRTGWNLIYQFPRFNTASIVTI